MIQMNGSQVQERRKENVIELLTLQEVAALCRVSVATVKYWMAMRRLRAVKLGKHPLVKREELLRFIKAAEAPGPGRPAYLESSPSHV